MNTANPARFRQRLREGERLVGTFIKTPTSHTTEIMGDLGFDFVVIDEEHAPFNRGTTDMALLGAKATGVAGLVRVARPDAASILAALDDGAIGVLIPHVTSAEKARHGVAAARYRGGVRGFSNSPRAGRYGGLGLAAHVAHNDAQTAVVAMIEDPEGVANIEAIAAVEGVDALFIGRGDLSVALGAESMDAPVVREAVKRIGMSARRAKMPLCAMVGSAGESGWLSDIGVTAFIVASDQAFMRHAAGRALNEFRSAGAKQT